MTKVNVHIQPKSSKSVASRVKGHGKHKVCHSDKICKIHNSKIKRRNKQALLNRVGKLKKGFKSAFLFDIERAQMDIPDVWKGTCIDEAIEDTKAILRGEDILPVCRADLWEPGQKITTEEEQVLRCLERGTYEDRRVARNIRELLAV